MTSWRQAVLDMQQSWHTRCTGACSLSCNAVTHLPCGPMCQALRDSVIRRSGAATSSILPHSSLSLWALSRGASLASDFVEVSHHIRSRPWPEATADRNTTVPKVAFTASTALCIIRSMYEPYLLEFLDMSVIVTGHGLTNQVLESCFHMKA